MQYTINDIIDVKERVGLKHKTLKGIIEKIDYKNNSDWSGDWKERILTIKLDNENIVKVEIDNHMNLFPKYSVI